MGTHELYGGVRLDDVEGLSAALVLRVLTSDGRLSDARTPLAHAASHAPGAVDDLSTSYIATARIDVSGGIPLLTGTVLPRKYQQYANTTQDGTIVLAGDLGGTATAPTVPGLATKVPTSRTITAGTGLSGGGDLTANRSLAVTYGVIAGTAAQGNDARLSDARTPTAHAASHATGGSDPVTAASIGAAAAVHVHSGADITTGTVAYARLPVGVVSSTVAAGDDARLTNARTPLAHAASHVPGQPDALTGYVLATAVGSASGVASLDSGGKIPTAQIPAIALTDYLGSVASQAAMLALTGQRGDWAFRSDTGTDWQLVAEPSTALASWQERHYPSSPVSSVNGRVGAVSGLAEASRLISAGAGLTGGGDLTADRALAVAYGSATNTAVQGNDARVVADQAAGTASIRTIGTGTLQAAAGSHVHADVPTTRQVIAGGGLTGGGALSGDVTLAASYGAVTPAAVSAAGAVGVAASLARSDHAHPGVPTARALSAGTGLSGGGDLSADRAFAVVYGIVAGTAAQGNDARLSDNRVPTGWADAAKFGAVGNGTTDDYAALAAAITSLPASGGVLHLAPNSNYKITSALTAKAYGLVIDGNGSSITQATANTDAITGTDITGLVLRDLTLIGTGAGTGKGIRLLRSANASIPKLHFERVVVRSFGSDGIELSNPITSVFANVEARSNGGHGWNVHGVSGGAAGTSCAFVGSYADANGLGGFHLDTMAYCSFNGCAADHNGVQYDLINCQGISFNGCGCETPVNRGVGYLGDSWRINGGFGINLDGCWTYAALTTSVYVTGSARGVVLSGFAENSPQAGAVNCVKTDVGTRVTLVDCNNVRPYSLASGTTSILNDGGGLSIPGYVYGAGTAYFEGDVGTSAATPASDSSLTPRGWVNTQLAGKLATSDARLSDARAWSLYTPGGETAGFVPTWNGAAYVGAAVTAPSVAEPGPSPGSVLNDGPRSGQNHFSVQLSRLGDAAFFAKSCTDIGAGYEEAPIFWVPDAAKQWVAARVSVGAPPTGGSSFSRAELREQNESGTDMGFDATDANTHRLQGRFRIVHAPAVLPDIVCAQLHNGSADRVAIRTQLVSGTWRLRIRFNGSTVTLDVGSTSDIAVGIANIQGFDWDYKIEVINGMVKVYVGLSTDPTALTVAKYTAGVALTSTGSSSWYFKQGCYVQTTTATDTASDYGEVWIGRQLTHWHTGWATPAPYYQAGLHGPSHQTGSYDPILPSIITLGSFGNGGSLAIDASLGDVYRAIVTGATSGLPLPTAPIDGDVINVEVLNSSGGSHTLTLNGSILLTTALSAAVVIANGKRAFLGLRYLSGVGWFLLAATVQQ